MTARAVLLLYLIFAGSSLSPVQAAPAVRASLPTQNWTTFQGNARHDGSASTLLEPALLALRWQTSLSSQPLSQAVEGGGRVFVTVDRYVAPADAPQLFAVGAGDGALNWSKAFGPVFSVNPPAYGYGNVYLQTGRPPGGAALLRAFDAVSGAAVFATEFAAQSERYLAPTVADGAIYVNGGFFGGLYRFEAVAGNVEWFASLPQYDGWTPTLDASRAYSYAGGILTALDRANGATVYALADPGFAWNGFDMGGALALGAGDIAVAIYNRRLVGFDVAAPAVAWERVADYSGQPAVRGGFVFALNAGALEARALVNGRLKWSWSPPPGEQLAGNVIATRAHLLVASSTTTYVIDARTRQAVWTFPAGGALSLGSDNLYIAGRNGVLTAIATPVTDAGTPVALALAGPTRVAENTSARYRAVVTYDDGSRIDRTLDAHWQLAPTEVASLSAEGVLRVVELFSPTQEVTLTVRYKEDGVALSATHTVSLYSPLSRDEFALRGLERARDITRSVAAQLQEAFRYESSAQTALPGGHPAAVDLESALRATQRAIDESETATEDLNRAIGELGPTP